MPVTITITGDNAQQALVQLKGLAAPFFQVPAAAPIFEQGNAPGAVEAVPQNEVQTVAEAASVEESETVKRKRRTKAEMDAARAGENAAVPGANEPAQAAEETAENLLGGGAVEPYSLIDPENGVYGSCATAFEWGAALRELIDAAKDEGELKGLSANNKDGAARLESEGYAKLLDELKAAMLAKAASFQSASKAGEPELTFKMIYDAFVKLASVPGKGATTVRALLEKLGVPKLRDPQTQKPLLLPEKFAEAWTLVQAELGGI